MCFRWTIFSVREWKSGPELPLLSLSYKGMSSTNWAPLLDISDLKRGNTPPMKLICSSNKKVPHYVTDNHGFISSEVFFFFSDYEKWSSQVRGSSNIQLGYFPNCFFSTCTVSLCVKSHSQQWRALQIKVKGINKHVNCGMHSQLFTLSRKNKTSHQILIYDLLIQLVCVVSLEMCNTP